MGTPPYPGSSAATQDPERQFGWDEHGKPFGPVIQNGPPPEAPLVLIVPGSIRWPGNFGAVNGSRVEYHDLNALMRDYPQCRHLDRIGRETGDQLIVAGTPFEQRSLTPWHVESEYHRYEMVGELPEGVRAEVSIIAAALGFPGGGLQVRYLRVPDPNTPERESITVEHLLDIPLLRIAG